MTEVKKPYHPTNLMHEILMFLGKQEGRWSTWGCSYYMPTVQSVFPVGTKPEVQQRYMRFLQTKGLVGGCGCGCRGDYAPTAEGLLSLALDSDSGLHEFKRWEKNRFSLGY